MTATNSHLKTAISYGFLSGQAHGKKFVKLLTQAGYSHSDNLKQTDILIAHSAGVWLIPPEAKPQLVVYVGSPLAQPSPSTTYRQVQTHNLRALHKKKRLLSGARIMALHVYYGFKQPRRNRSVIKNARSSQPVEFNDCQTVFIANKDDPWPKSTQLESLLQVKNWAFISLPGSHDNIWEYPEHYVAIINHYAGLLAKTDG